MKTPVLHSRLPFGDQLHSSKAVHQLPADRSRAVPLLLGMALLAPIVAMAGAADLVPSPTTAIENPDQFNWTVFVNLCRKAPPSEQTTVKGQFRSNNALWETWADNELTFPTNPIPNNPPRWADRRRTKKVSPSGLEHLLRIRRHAAGGNTNLAIAISPVQGGGEEVRRNEPAFDYIIKRGLFYKEGLGTAFAAGVGPEGYPSGKTVTFPSDAIEVKGDWAPINSANSMLNTNNCHWNYDDQGNVWGLVGFHVMTKMLPTWTWATFEWVKNPTASWKAVGAVGRSDWIGTRDAFGYSYPQGPAGGLSPFQAPVFATENPLTPSGKPYPGGTMSASLASLFQKAGYRGEWLMEWSHYRLKGSQVAFTDATGASTLLGNSSTEGVLAPNHDLTTSSCITCHALANVGTTGGVVVPPSFVTGPVNPTNFFDLATFDPRHEHGNYKLIALPADFVWSFLHASNAVPGRSAVK